MLELVGLGELLKWLQLNSCLILVAEYVLNCYQSVVRHLLALFNPITKCNKKLIYSRNSARRRLLCCSRSLKVTESARKSSKFVNNTNLRPTSHRFSVVAQCLSNYRLWRMGVSRQSSLILGKVFEYRHKSYTRYCCKPDFLATFLPQTMGLATSLMSLL